MNIKRIIWGGLAGGIILFLLEWLVYGFLLKNFFAANQGTATGVDRAPEDMRYLHIFIGMLSMGFMFAIVLRWANATTAIAGLKSGFILGILNGINFDFVMYGTSNIMNMNRAFTDIAAWTIISMIGGAVVAMVIGMEKKGAPAT